jgi:hypothetical protein
MMARMKAKKAPRQFISRSASNADELAGLHAECVGLAHSHSHCNLLMPQFQADEKIQLCKAKDSSELIALNVIYCLYLQNK